MPPVTADTAAGVLCAVLIIALIFWVIVLIVRGR